MQDSASLVVGNSQFSSVAQSFPTLCDPMDCSTPGYPVHHQLLGLAQTHVHRIGDAIQPSHPLSSPSPPTINLSSQFIKKTMFDSALTISIRVIKTGKWWTIKIIMVNTNNMLTKALFSPMYIYKLIFTTLKLVLLLYQSYCFCSKCVKLMQIKHNYKRGHNYEVMDMLCSLVVVITVYVYQVFTL